MHPLLILGLVVIAVALASTIYNNITSRCRRLENLKASFGKPPEEDDSLQLESISRYSQYIQQHNPTQQRVDTITWNDLDMDSVFKRINTCQTSVGEEYLYHNLHNLPLNDNALTKRESLVQFFESNPDTRLSVQALLASRVGKENYNGLTALMFTSSINLLKYRHIYTALALLPLVMSLVIIFHVPLGVIGIVGSFIINMFVHYSLKSRITIEIPSIKYLGNLLRCCKSLLKMKPLKHLPTMAEIEGLYKTLKPIRRKAPNMPSATGELMDSFLEYARIMFLSDIRNYNKFMRMIKERSQEFHALYRAFGELDLSICVLSFRLSLPIYTLPEFYGCGDIQRGNGEAGTYASTARAEDDTSGAGDSNPPKFTLAFEKIFHPLIPEPVTNSGMIKNDSLLTGSNASGKSTFIKALAINGILAQTINTCAAKSFKTRFSLIMTSMVVRDDLSAGESYFIVEIKSLKRVLDMVQNYPCTCYIDEILRGTNTIERIAASASVLAYLHKQDALCIAASHDIELTYILDGQYDNYHFREQVTDDGIVFDYKLNDGPSTTRNAIKLLDFMGFEEEIVTQAEGLAEGYAARPVASNINRPK